MVRRCSRVAPCARLARATGERAYETPRLRKPQRPYVTMIICERLPYGDSESQPNTKCRQHCDLDEKLRLVSLTYETGACFVWWLAAPQTRTCHSLRAVSSATPMDLMQQDAVEYAGNTN